MPRRTDIERFCLGYHACGRTYGIYLWDVDYHDLDDAERAKIEHIATYFIDNAHCKSPNLHTLRTHEPAQG